MMVYCLFLLKDFTTAFTYSWKRGEWLLEAECNLFISDNTASTMHNTLISFDSQ
jgi:hypothetical protein